MLLYIYLIKKFIIAVNCYISRSLNKTDSIRSNAILTPHSILKAIALDATREKSALLNGAVIILILSAQRRHVELNYTTDE